MVTEAEVECAREALQAAKDNLKRLYEQRLQELMPLDSLLGACFRNQKFRHDTGVGECHWVYAKVIGVTEKAELLIACAQKSSDGRLMLWTLEVPVTRDGRLALNYERITSREWESAVRPIVAETMQALGLS